MAKIKDVADFFIETTRGGEPMTLEKLNCLMYFAQGRHLARTGKPLFDADFYACEDGPFLPELVELYCPD